MSPHEINANRSATYEECMSWYRQMEQDYPDRIRIQEAGATDAGIPLHVVLVSNDGNFNIASWKSGLKEVILIMNGIHPGEPDGIDASMILLRDLMHMNNLPDHIALAIIPVYNIGGALLRSPHYRPDQNGPEAFGSRGNSQNLDLNRDFIKCDSKEARTFAGLFRELDPLIFIDNHVSDGADYQNVMTLATTQYDKLGPVMGPYLYSIFEPALYRRMEEKNAPMLPYCNAWGWDAKKGWTQFFDSPRYSSGYAALFQTFGFVVETHMLKPYADRVRTTLLFLHLMIEHVADHAEELSAIRQKEREQLKTQWLFPLQWKVDSSMHDMIDLHGYAYKTRTSEVSGLQVPYYDHKEPYTAKVPFYNHFKTSLQVSAPEAYILPIGWWKVAELLKMNGVRMHRIPKGEQFQTEQYRILSYKSSPAPFETHHFNSQVETESVSDVYTGNGYDWYIPVNQEAKRFIIETLEPGGMDSYFAWNFFDAILVRKEGYSDYAYEEIAAAFLHSRPDLQIKLEEKRTGDMKFANDAGAQLEWVYGNSESPEPRFMRYPVLRVVKNAKKTPLMKGIQQGPLLNKHDE